MQNPKTAILFQSHLVSGPIVEECHRIRQATENFGHVFFLYHRQSDAIPPLLKDQTLYTVSDDSLTALNYPMIGEKLLPGHAQFPLLQFFRDRPEFDYYWLIEYDVRFSGDWRLFFDAFKDSSADFITCNIRGYDEEPDWWWWSLHHPQKSIPPSQRLHSFNTVYRLSRSSLAFLHDALVNGWCGHHEVMLPTLLYHGGFSIRDIGGRGRFTPPGMEDRFYTSSAPNRRGILKSGTMRYRPPFRRMGSQKNKLYHPVKPFSSIFRDKIKYLLAIDWPLIKRRFFSKQTL